MWCVIFNLSTPKTPLFFAPEYRITSCYEKTLIKNETFLGKCLVVSKIMLTFASLS